MRYHYKYSYYLEGTLTGQRPARPEIGGGQKPMRNISQSASTELNDSQVEGFLQRHPDFLVERPELLTQLNVPHQTPEGVSSLIERQVASLRAENQHYRQQLEFLTNTQGNILSLTERVHQLALQMLSSEQPADACALLNEYVHKDYHADAAALFLFLDQNPFTDITLVEVRHRNDKLRLLLAELFNRGKPLLDSLQAEHVPLMFGKTTNINSSILLPIIGDKWDGLLVIGSEQRDRYQRGPALELLIFLTRLTAIQLNHWLESADCTMTSA